MSILQVVLKSLREMLWPRRFLPFFLLYFSLALALYGLLFPIVKIIFSPITSQFLILDIILIFLIFIFGLLVNLWFIAALVESVKTKNFERSLNRVKKSYLQLIALSLVTISLSLITSLFSAFKTLIRLVLDWILFFSLPAIVLDRLSFEKGIKKSFHLFRKKMVETIVFWFINRSIIFVLILIFIFSLFFIAALSMTSVLTLDKFQNLESSQKTFILLLSNSSFMLSIIFLAALFLSFITAFDYSSRAYYFLELTKGKKKRKGRRK